MTENEVLIKTPEEAIETIKSNMPTSGYQMLRESLDMAISALKEIQQYREVDAQIKKIFDDQLGLVDIVKEYIEDIRRTHNGKTPRKVIALSEEDAQNWEDYKKIGTVEECREAVDKQKPKKIIIEPYRPAKCPTCDHELSTSLGDGYYKHPIFLERCPECGQAIQWDENLEGMEDE